ncbi:DUF881 domain-containing protein [Bacillus daqingensis]|uniref:DUF881 domain-containing protein n=1 Tax=Bacillus daqingensis TaxID=872396 RepID=A0ABV9NU71_9BACI
MKWISAAAVFFVSLLAGLAISSSIESEEGFVSDEAEAAALQIENELLEEQVEGLQRSLREQEEMSAAQDASTVTEEQLMRLRMLAGDVAVKGEGLRVELDDTTTDSDNPSAFLVHEQHVQRAVDELLTAGAEAVAVNGVRLSQSSYIKCIGPVIEVDGIRSTAPFVVEAIGDSSVLEASMELRGGAVYELLADNVQVRMETLNEIIIPEVRTGGEAG